MAKPYGLAKQKLCYIQIYITWRRRQKMFLRMIGEYGPRLQILGIRQRISFYLKVPFMTIVGFVARVEQDQAAQNVQPDP